MATRVPVTCTLISLEAVPAVAATTMSLFARVSAVVSDGAVSTAVATPFSLVVSPEAVSVPKLVRKVIGAFGMATFPESLTIAVIVIPELPTPPEEMAVALEERSILAARGVTVPPPPGLEDPGSPPPPPHAATSNVAQTYNAACLVDRTKLNIFMSYCSSKISAQNHDPRSFSAL